MAAAPNASSVPSSFGSPHPTTPIQQFAGSGAPSEANTGAPGGSLWPISAMNSSCVLVRALLLQWFALSLGMVATLDGSGPYAPARCPFCPPPARQSLPLLPPPGASGFPPPACR